MKIDFNTDADHINIPLNKYRLTGFLLMTLAIGAGGLCLIIYPSILVSTSTYHGRYKATKPDVIDMGLICVIFSIPATAFFINKVFSFKPGLTIDGECITYNSSLTSWGFIKWSEITEISTECVGSADYIMIHVNNPEEYIESIQNSYKRRSALANYKKYGVPIAINTDPLKCDFNELYAFLTETLDTYKAAAKKYSRMIKPS